MCVRAHVALLLVVAAWMGHQRTQPYARRVQNVLATWLFVSEVLLLLLAVLYCLLTQQLKLAREHALAKFNADDQLWQHRVILRDLRPRRGYTALSPMRAVAAAVRPRSARPSPSWKARGPWRQRARAARARTASRAPPRASA